ncbi:MAG: type I methionyl aminopeptidase [Rickettsiales bacterium]
MQYSIDDFKRVKESGKIVAKVLNYIEEFIKPGVSTKELDDLCHQFIIKHGGRPACLNYKGFPKSICTSINDVICHGIPNKKDILKEGDIINIDLVVEKDGMHADACRMFKVGKISEQAQKLIDVCRQALYLGIDAAKYGNKLGDIGFAIQNFVEANGFSVVRDYCGHGIGKSMHEEPQILHFGKPNTGMSILPGMIFTIEPMINIGAPETKLMQDKWTVKTKDGSLSAQFEHTIGINEEGKAEILTKFIE